MDNKFNVDDPAIQAVLGPFAPVPTYHMDVRSAVSALTMAYMDEPIDCEAVVVELAPYLVRALDRGTVKRRAKTKKLPAYADRLKWAETLIRGALAPRMLQANP